MRLVQCVKCTFFRFVENLRTVYEYYTDENKRWVAGSKVEIMALGK